MTTFSSFWQRLLLLPLLLLGHLASRAQGVGIGTTAPNASAALDIVSGSKGVLLPRVASTSAVSGPATGLIVYQTGSPAGYYYYTGAAWQALGADNLGNHTATQNLNLQANALTGTGASISGVGIGVRADGGLNLGQTTGNIFLGYQAGQATTPQSSGEGTNNLFSGTQAGYSNTTGFNNQFSGYQSGFSNTVGFNNLVSGLQAGYSNTTGFQNTFSGIQSGYNNTIGSNNLFSGNYSGYSNTSGNFNVLSGYSSGYSTTTGSQNVFSGAFSGYNNTTGGSNVFNGHRSGNFNTTGNNNVFSGWRSGYSNTTGGNNTFSGYQSGYSNTTGDYNTALGYQSGPAGGSGAITNATALGANVSLTQSNTVVLGNGANVGIGTSAPDRPLTVQATSGSTEWLSFKNSGGDTKWHLNGNLGGFNLSESGVADYRFFAQPGGNVGIGTSAPAAKLEVQGGADSDGSYDPVALAFGYRTGGFRHFLRSRHNGNPSARGNALDFYLNNSASATGSSFPGTGNVQVLTLENNGGQPRVGIGTVAPSQTLDVVGTTQTTNAIVTTALTGNGADIGGVVGVGVRADGGLNLGQNVASGSIYLGYQAGRVNMGNNNLFSGYQSGYSNTAGSYNAFDGYQSGYSNTTGNYNAFDGYQSGYNNTTGGYNVLNGAFSGYANTTGQDNACSGYGSGRLNTTGSGNVFSGSFSGYNNTTGSNNVFSGYLSGYNNTVGTNNTAVGYHSGYNSSTFTNTTALGANASVSASNSIQLGDANITTLSCQVGLTVTSDARFKYDVQADVPGLAFIARLRPVTYRFDDERLTTFERTGTLAPRSAPDPAATVHTGFLAQEVEATAQALGFRFDGVHAPANARDHYGLGYAQFVVPLVRAVQELSAENSALKVRTAVLEARVAQAEADHASLLSLQAQVARLLGEGAQAQK